MKQTIEDKLVSKVSKGKLNTIHVSREEILFSPGMPVFLS